MRSFQTLPQGSVLAHRVKTFTFNQSKIGFRARLFDKADGVKPIAIVDLAPSGNWTVAPNCFAVCLTAFFAKMAKQPATLIGKRIIVALNMND